MFSRNRIIAILMSLLVGIVFVYGSGATSAAGSSTSNAQLKTVFVDGEDETALLAELTEEAMSLGIDVAPDDSVIDVYEKIQDAKEATSLEDLVAKAKELGINIEGLPYDEAKAKLEKELTKLQSNDPKIAAKQKLLIEALSDKNITKEDEKKYKDALNKFAKDFDIDISGLSVKAAIAKIKKELSYVDVSDVTNSFQTKSILDAAQAIRNKDKTALLKITKTKIFDDILKTKVSEMSYEKARDIIIRALKDHTKVDITKGKWETVRDKIIASLRAGMQEEAKFYGVDIKGLSDADAQAKIMIAQQIMLANEMVEMQKYAVIYGVDVTGLSKEEGWAKIKAVIQAEIDAGDKELAKLAEFYNINIKGLDRSEAWEKVKFAIVQAEADKVGVDIKGLSTEEAWKKVKEAQWSMPQENTLEQEAAKWNVDITGLSVDDAWVKVKEAMKKAEMEKSTTPTPEPSPTPTPKP